MTPTSKKPAATPAGGIPKNSGIKSYRTGWLTRLIRPGVYAEPTRAPYAAEKRGAK